jgi:hypothetical protein
LLLALSQIDSTVVAFGKRERADGVLPALSLRKQETVIHLVATQTGKVGEEELIRESMTVIRVSYGTMFVLKSHM